MAVEVVSKERYIEEWNKCLAARQDCQGLRVFNVPVGSESPTGYEFEPPQGAEAYFLSCKKELDQRFRYDPAA